MLFAGCSRVKGPNDGDFTMEESTFTADDVAKFQELSGSPTVSGTGTLTAEMGTGGVQVEDVTETENSVVSGLTVDAAELARLDAMRTMTSGKGGYRVTNEFLNVRATPSSQGANLGRLDKGQALEVLEFTNASWAKVKFNDKEGYVSAKYIGKVVSSEMLEQEKKAFENMYYVNFGFVNVRAEPKTTAAKLGQIDGQAFVRPLSIDGQWAKVAFEDKEGYVSMQFLAPFRPPFLVRQDSYALPILHYDVSQEGIMDVLISHIAALKKSGVHFITLRELYDTVLAQEGKDISLREKSVVIAVSGLTIDNIKRTSDAISGAGAKATFFLETKLIGVSGINEKSLLTLQANGFDLQSGGHTGDDLRSLTSAQVKLEVEQSRKLLEDLTRRSVFAILYPQGGVNERVMQRTHDAGYLFGIANNPEKTFNRDEFLRLPSIAVTSGMTADDVVRLVQ
jgi:uncharacterized protein YgiM (DUF1202 family)/peptidoglycan/xylan/chitin deacetylase (PgdA/CDA1 family)